MDSVHRAPLRARRRGLETQPLHQTTVVRSVHDHIIQRLCPAMASLQEAGASEASSKKKIRAALEEIRAEAGALPLQAALDISSAVMTIEEALVT